MHFRMITKSHIPLSHVQNFINLVLCGIKDLYHSEMTVKLKSNLYIWPVNIFLILKLYMTTTTEQNKHHIIYNNHFW